MGNFLTGKLYIPLSNLRRNLRPDMREIFQIYKRSLKFRHDSLHWSNDQKRDWILQTLRILVRRANETTAFYKEQFRAIGFDANADFSFEDYSKLPILEREDIQKAGIDLISKALPQEKLLKDATGGSTGKPAEIRLGPEERGWKEAGMEYSFNLVGVQAFNKTAYFWGHHLDPQTTDNFRDRFKSFVTNIRWFDCFRLSPEVFQKYHEEFSKWSPECIVAYASALGHFAEYIKEKGIIARNYPQKCFVTGAEKLFSEHRKIIEEVFNKPVYERYGGRDFGLLGIQTNPSENLHYTLDWAWGLVEPETEEENSPVLVTKLHADGMPMLRYRIGDVGKFPSGSQPGYPVFALNEIIGRDLDRIWRLDGSYLHANQFPHMLKDFLIKEFMLIQAEDYNVELQIVPQNGFNENSEKEIERIITANLNGLSVIIKKVEEIQRTKANKWRPVITKVKR